MNFKDSVPPEEIVNCEICDKEIWKYWYRDGMQKKSDQWKEINQCGPCYFKHDKK